MEATPTSSDMERNLEQKNQIYRPEYSINLTNSDFALRYKDTIKNARCTGLVIHLLAALC